MKYYKIGDNIYRQIKSEPDKAMLCTPDKDADRVIDIDSSLVEVKRQVAKEEINRQWDSYSDEWVYNNKKYMADKTLLALGDLYSKKRHSCVNGLEYDWTDWEFNGEYGKHTFKHEYKFKGEDRVYEESYWLGQFQGKLIWYTPYHYCPQAYAFNFNGVDVEPSGFGIGYIPMKHIKPVYCITDKKWI